MAKKKKFEVYRNKLGNIQIEIMDIDQTEYFDIECLINDIATELNLNTNHLQDDLFEIEVKL